MPRRPDHHLQDLQNRLAYQFQRPDLLSRALTHASASAIHLERQEFLGDAVLGLVISEALVAAYPEASEGELSRMRAMLVRKAALLKVAETLALPGLLHVGEGERHANGSLRSLSIAANAVEALIGAVFEDGGWQAVRPLVLGLWQEQLAQADHQESKDAKSRLQELTQSQAWGLPEYQIRDAGPHARLRFEAECRVQGKVVGRGKGNRKKQAELMAAEEACQHLLAQGEPI